ncbi:barstar family protein [Agromyces sp. H66]|uniref:barstar family protein n=1 Tax=Agromyces sp. H66 TaxID=2529859 RepID=UPI0010AB053D|nr:barstar family protein [Agromyces sp. H66]
MSAFDPEEDLGHDLGFRLLWNTPVTLFYRPHVLEETSAWLAEHGYQITVLDASSWSAEADLHRDVAQALSFPDYYGHNLDALNDCLRDVVSQGYGWNPHATGLVLVFTGYDAFAARRPRPAQVVLDLLAKHSRVAALLGRRMICLVQSNDPRISFDAVGADPVLWNDAEWLNPSRPSNSSTMRS